MDATPSSRVPQAEPADDFAAQSCRERLLLAATDLFAEKGFSKSTLRDLGRRTGVNPALVSYYFGSKAGLREQVMARRVMLSNEILSRMLPDDVKLSPETIPFFVKKLHETAQSDAEIQQFHQWVGSEDDPETKAALHDLMCGGLWMKVLDRVPAAPLPEAIKAARARMLTMIVSKWLEYPNKEDAVMIAEFQQTIAEILSRPLAATATEIE